MMKHRLTGEAAMKLGALADDWDDVERNLNDNGVERMEQQLLPVLLLCCDFAKKVCTCLRMDTLSS